MIKQDFIDTFREKYLNKKGFTWSNGKDKTRIDQIWVLSILGYDLEEASIEDMSIDTGSDHDLVSARLILNHLEYKSSLA